PLRKSASKGNEVGGGGPTKRKGPAAVKPQALSPFRPRYSAAGDVHLQVGEVDLALLFERGGGLVDVLPAAVAAVVPAGVRLQVALAADAQRRVRQGVEAPDGDLGLADFAQAVGALLEARQGAVDLRQLARVQLGQVRVHLVAARLEGGVGGVA